MRSHKILHIISGDLWAGAEMQMLMQIQALRAKGVDASVLLFNDAETARRYIAIDIPCIIVSEEQGFFLFCYSALKNSRKLNPQIVVSHGYKETFVAALVGAYLRIPLISTFHGLEEEFHGFASMTMWMYHRIHLLLSRYFAARVVTVSSALAEDLYFRRKSPMKEKLRVIHNVVDGGGLDTDQTVHGAASLLFPYGTPAIIIVGRLVPIKRVELAIEAIKILIEETEVLPFTPQANTQEFMFPDPSALTEKIHLYIVGDGPALASLKSRIATHGENLQSHIHFLGFRNDATRLIASADLLLITSRSEGIPTVLLQAMYFRTPVVSTPLSGVKEVLELVPHCPITFAMTSSSHDIAQAIKEALRKSTAAPRNPNNGLKEQFRRYFSPTTAAEKHIALYDEVLSRKQLLRG